MVIQPKTAVHIFAQMLVEIFRAIASAAWRPENFVRLRRLLVTGFSLSAPALPVTLVHR
jgi:hypothetical protein